MCTSFLSPSECLRLGPKVGLDEYFAEVLPQDEAAKVKDVSRRVGGP